MRRVPILLLLAGVLGLLSVSADAQECSVAEVGPFSLAATQQVIVCGTNLYGNGDIKVGIATFNALDAREPLDLRFVSLRPREGFCLSPRLSSQAAGSADSALTRMLIVQAGAAIGTTPDTAFPIVLSVQRDLGLKSSNSSRVDAADYVVWRKSDVTVNPPNV